MICLLGYPRQHLPKGKVSAVPEVLVWPCGGGPSTSLTHASAPSRTVCEGVSGMTSIATASKRTDRSPALGACHQPLAARLSALDGGGTQGNADRVHHAPPQAHELMFIILPRQFVVEHADCNAFKQQPCL